MKLGISAMLILLLIPPIMSFERREADYLVESRPSWVAKGKYATYSYIVSSGTKKFEHLIELIIVDVYDYGARVVILDQTKEKTLSFKGNLVYYEPSYITDEALGFLPLIFYLPKDYLEEQALESLCEKLAKKQIKLKYDEVVKVYAKATKGKVLTELGEIETMTCGLQIGDISNISVSEISERISFDLNYGLLVGAEGRFKIRHELTEIPVNFSLSLIRSDLTFSVVSPPEFPLKKLPMLQIALILALLIASVFLARNVISSLRKPLSS